MFLHAVGTAAGIPMNLDLSVDLESRLPVGANILNGTGAFETALRVGIHAGVGRGVVVEKIGRLHRDRDRRDIEEGFRYAVTRERVVDDAPVHRVIGRHDGTGIGAVVPVGGPAARGRRLPGDSVDEDIRLGVCVGRKPVRLVGDCAQGGGGVDGDRFTVDRATGRRGFRAVGGIADGGVAGIAGDGD